jgi:hypothetical protein
VVVPSPASWWPISVGIEIPLSSVVWSEGADRVVVYRGEPEPSAYRAPYTAFLIADVPGNKGVRADLVLKKVAFRVRRILQTVEACGKHTGFFSLNEPDDLMSTAV